MKSIDHSLTTRTELSSKTQRDRNTNDDVTIINKSELQNLLNPLPKEVAIEELMEKLGQWITDKTNGRYILTENSSSGSKENLAKLRSSSIPVLHTLIDSSNLVCLQEYNALTQDQTIPTLDSVDSILSTEGIKAQAALEAHELIVTVGEEGGDQPTINAAIAKLEKDYSKGANHSKAIIRLLPGHIIKEQIVIENKDLSWITLASEAEEVALDVSYITRKMTSQGSFLYANKAKSLNLSLKLSKVGDYDGNFQELSLIFIDNESEITINNCKFSGFLCNQVVRVTMNSVANINNTIFEGVSATLPDNPNYSRCLEVDRAKININGGAINGNFGIGINICQSKITVNNFAININNIKPKDAYGIYLNPESEIDFNEVKISGSYYGISNLSRCNAKLTNCNIISSETALNTSECNIILENTYLESTNTNNPRVLQSNDDSSFNAINSTFKSHSNQGVFINKTKGAKLINCRLISPPNQQGLLAWGRAEVIVDGGNYRASDNQPYSQNILAASEGSIIRLINSPLGSASESSGGKIIKD